MANDEAMVEAMARAICLEDGRMGDTDAVEQQRVDRDWRDYEPHARALLPLIQSHTALAVEEAVERERERCLAAVEGERLTDPQPGTGDEAYEQALTDAVTAIRQGDR